MEVSRLDQQVGMDGYRSVERWSGGLEFYDEWTSS
jgi:hypothetical protein